MKQANNIRGVCLLFYCLFSGRHDDLRLGDLYRQGVLLDQLLEPGGKQAGQALRHSHEESVPAPAAEP